MEMNYRALTQFEFHGASVRTVMIKGEPWFVAADVCAILEIGNPREAVRSLPQKGVSTADILTEGGIQKVKVVNEANLPESGDSQAITTIARIVLTS
jgi:prophage antirepressor-like protein